jgi:hypothetical protein
MLIQEAQRNLMDVVGGCVVCALHGESPWDRWSCVLPSWQINVNVNVQRELLRVGCLGWENQDFRKFKWRFRRGRDSTRPQ